MSDADWAWLAGFLDGEGSFQLRYQRSARDRHQTSTVACVSVSQAEPRTEVLDWLKQQFGGSVASHGTNDRNSRHNAARRWGVTGARALVVCKGVLPHLKLKRRHAEIVIEHQATKLSSHVGCRKGLPRSAVRVSPEIQALRAAHVAEMAALNKRGTHVDR